MKPMKFKSTNNDDYLIIISKFISRIAHLKEMHWGDNNCDGQAYEYCYDVIVDGYFVTLDEYELKEALEDMKFVEVLE